MFDASEAVDAIIEGINGEAKFEAVCDELANRVNDGELTEEDANIIGEYAYDVYVEGTARRHAITGLRAGVIAGEVASVVTLVKAIKDLYPLCKKYKSLNKNNPIEKVKKDKVGKEIKAVAKKYGITYGVERIVVLVMSKQAQSLMQAEGEEQMAAAFNAADSAMKKFMSELK